MANPLVDLLSLTQHAESASLKALRRVDLLGCIVMRSFNVPRTYRSIRFTAI
jgi:hypothetical protein